MFIPVFIIAYLIGSLPFSIIAGYLLSGEDIRNKGSGNAGATNVFRILGWKAALIVSIADFLKAFLPVFFANKILMIIQADNIQLLYFKIGILIFIILGHVFPVWAQFKGGKGVAAAAGGISALFPPAFPFCLSIFIATVSIGRYVSLASLITAWTLPAFYLFFSLYAERAFSSIILVFFIFTAGLITIFHHKNIVRLLKGNEPKISLKKDK